MEGVTSCIISLCSFEREVIDIIEDFDEFKTINNCNFNLKIILISVHLLQLSSKLNIKYKFLFNV